ncbi:MAG: hypothetical protein NXH82_14130 [Rhodobacteraceae bacterium]|nr:hypothetical protein [Paracoccaceae bacterium]
MADRDIRSAPDYTVPALVMMGVNLIWIFLAIWAAFGLLPVLLLALGLNHVLERVAARRGVRLSPAVPRGRGRD